MSKSAFAPLRRAHPRAADTWLSTPLDGLDIRIVLIDGILFRDPVFSGRGVDAQGPRTSWRCARDHGERDGVKALLADVRQRGSTDRPTLSSEGARPAESNRETAPHRLVSGVRCTRHGTSWSICPTRCARMSAGATEASLWPMRPCPASAHATGRRPRARPYPARPPRSAKGLRTLTLRARRHGRATAVRTTTRSESHGSSALRPQRPPLADGASRALDRAVSTRRNRASGIRGHADLPPSSGLVAAS